MVEIPVPQNDFAPTLRKVVWVSYLQQISAGDKQAGLKKTGIIDRIPDRGKI